MGEFQTLSDSIFGKAVHTLNQIRRRDVITGAGTVTWRYGYDADGNQVSKTDGTDTWVRVFNEDNRLLSESKNGVLQVSFTYDQRGRMVTRTAYTGGVPEASSKFRWDGWDLVEEISPDSVLTRYFAPQGTLHSFERSGVTYFCHYDSLGCVRAITNSDGDVVSHFEYDAWGNHLASSQDGFSDTFPYTFLGSYGVRTDIGLMAPYYVRARWLDPNSGRFISRDTRLGENRYVYCRNKPTDSIDVNGGQDYPWWAPWYGPTPGYTIFGNKIPEHREIQDVAEDLRTGGAMFAYGELFGVILEGAFMGLFPSSTRLTGASSSMQWSSQVGTCVCANEGEEASRMILHSYVLKGQGRAALETLDMIQASGLEAALISYRTELGQSGRAIVTGGPTGIVLDVGEAPVGNISIVTKVPIHTHPAGDTVPSGSDMKMLFQKQQKSAYIRESGKTRKYSTRHDVKNPPVGWKSWSDKVWDVMARLRYRCPW